MERPAAYAANGLSSMVESQQQAVGPWGDEVALETVCFGCCSPNRPAPFDGRRNVAVSRGSLDPLPFHIFEDVNSPVKEVVADFAASVCREPSPTVLTSNTATQKASRSSGNPCPHQAKRAARQEVASQGHQTGASSTKCNDETTRSYLCSSPAGCCILPAICGYVLCYPQHIAV